jgi:hypothetical protein
MTVRAGGLESAQPQQAAEHEKTSGILRARTRGSRGGAGM